MLKNIFSLCFPAQTVKNHTIGREFQINKTTFQSEFSDQKARILVLGGKINTSCLFYKINSRPKKHKLSFWSGNLNYSFFYNPYVPPDSAASFFS